MSFGWKRTEVVGALINACSLLALCMYIILEAIPRFVHPEAIEANYYFLGIAGSGIVINFIGTIIFYFTGTHAHAHAHDEADELDIEAIDDHSSSINNDETVISLEGERDHHHDHDHDHHGHHHDHEHDHHHSHGDKAKKDKKKKHSHDHSHGGHGHSHGGHGHSHGGHGHSHDHSDGGHDHSHGGHGHSHDMNMWAVFVHYLGDAISSVFVLVTGLLIHFFPKHRWTLYLDPGSSLIIVAIMLYTTIPLVRQCALILLQRVPPHINLSKLRNQLHQIDHVQGIHDLHVWCLVDGMTISTVHVTIDNPSNFDSVCNSVRKIFHRYGIHSSTIQPEYHTRHIGEANTSELSVMSKRSANLINGSTCIQNCAPECNEDWCCKDVPSTPAPAMTHGALDFDPVFNPREVLPPRLSPPPADVRRSTEAAGAHHHHHDDHDHHDHDHDHDHDHSGHHHHHDSLV